MENQSKQIRAKMSKSQKQKIRLIISENHLFN